MIILNDSNSHQKTPSFKEMTKNLLEALQQAAKEGVEKRSPEQLQKIAEICVSCEKFIPTQNRCGQCGCYLSFKTQLKAWHCPLKKW